MAGFIPIEGRLMRGSVVWMNLASNRLPHMELGLFTNPDVDIHTTAAEITEPTGGGYSRIPLLDENWDVDVEEAEFFYPQQAFEAEGSDMVGDIHGYFIMLRAIDNSPFVVVFEKDPTGPFTLKKGDKYSVTPKIRETSI